MSKNHTNHLIVIKRITYFWVALLAFSIISLAINLQLNRTIATERLVHKDKLEMSSMGYLLAQKSDFLTSEARNCSVTANPEHLMLYWDEVDLHQKRDYAVRRLEQLSGNKSEIGLLALSKANSDALILTEIKSMRLVLDAHQVPEELMPMPVRRYILTADEKALTPNQKMLLAQKILFDDTYLQNKKRIMDPIKQFTERLAKRTLEEQSVIQARADHYQYALFACTVALALCIFCIIWMRILYLR